MNDYPNSVKNTLTSLIIEMSASPALFVKNPAKDFTRKRKLPFETVMLLLLSMDGKSIYKELLEAQGYDENTRSIKLIRDHYQVLLSSKIPHFTANKNPHFCV